MGTAADSGRIGGDTAGIRAGAVPAPDLAERLAAMRRSYEQGGLDESDLAADWLTQFLRWFDAAVDAGIPEPNAMIVATASMDARPSARTVLLKSVDERGLAFYTHYTSRKGRQALANPAASLVFPWHPIQRQVLVTGWVERVTEAESDAYFASRPRGSQLGAAASAQSTVIASRAELEAARDALAARYPEGTPVPRPPNWGGLRVLPETVEFWQGREDRLHDRLRFRLLDPTVAAPAGDTSAWVVERLAP